MLAALIIVFREVLEAGVVTGVVLAASRGIPARGRWVGFGIVGGLLGSVVIALFAGEIANLFEGSGQEVLNALILAVAVVMLVWTVVWMASHGAHMAAEFKAIGLDVLAGQKSLAALAIAVGMAVLREGAEVVLFLYSILATGADSQLDVAIGGAAGIVLGGFVSMALYFGLVAIPLRYLFKTTAVLISLLAAGLAAQAVGITQSVGFLQPLSDPVWDSSWLLGDESAVGRVLHTLVGYQTQPTGMQLIAYASVLAAIVALCHAVRWRLQQVRRRTLSVSPYHRVTR